MKKKEIIAAVLLLAVCFSCKSQVTVKKDVTAYFRQLPQPPSTLEEAYKNCNCLTATGSVQSSGQGVAASVHDSVKADLMAMGTLTNSETQQVQQATALHNQATADNVGAMNKSQQLAWVQNNMQSTGNASGMAAFAQKMQDPAEAAKFKALTPDQKIAYLKANGMDPAKSSSQVSQTDTAVSSAILKQSQMQTDLSKPQSNPWATMLQQMLSEFWQGGTADAQKRLQQMNDAYVKALAAYSHIDSAYGMAMTTARYGYSGDANQDDAVSKLSGGQYLVLNQVLQLESFLNGIYQFGATQEAKQLKTKKP